MQGEWTVLLVYSIFALVFMDELYIIYISYCDRATYDVMNLLLRQMVKMCGTKINHFI